MAPSHQTRPRIAAAALLISTALFSTGCDVTKTLLNQALKGFVAYFDTSTTREPKLTRLSDRVLTYNWYFDRTLVIETDAGLVVVDSFDEHLAEGLMHALQSEGIDAPVHTLIYTHYHFDHTKGGAVLDPTHVLCHAKCEAYWDDHPAEDSVGVLRPTRTIEGDQRLRIGGVSIELIDLGHSHTDTMFAVLLPDERLLYAADTVGIGVLLPAGGVSLYYPAYLAALDRLQGLEFDTFVSSHFGWGTKAEFIEAADLQRDGYHWAREAYARYYRDDEGIAMTQDSDRFLAAFGFFYDRMKAKYGDWHGFDAMILNTFMNNLIAVLVGD